MNGITFITPKVPSLYTALSAPQDLRMDPRIYGANLIASPVNYGDVVEVVINNQTPLLHPWHLHGHQYQVVARSDTNATLEGKLYDPSMADPQPMRRDTIGIRQGGWVAIRFRADNPGIQLIHCHIEWHVEAGLSAAILEATDRLGNLEIPWEHKQACVKQGIPLRGNAAGNSVDWLDLTGANMQPMIDMGALWTMGKGYPEQQSTHTSGGTLSAFYRKMFGWIL